MNFKFYQFGIILFILFNQTLVELIVFIALAFITNQVIHFFDIQSIPFVFYQCCILIYCLNIHCALYNVMRERERVFMKIVDKHSYMKISEIKC